MHDLSMKSGRFQKNCRKSSNIKLGSACCMLQLRGPPDPIGVSAQFDETRETSLGSTLRYRKASEVTSELISAFMLPPLSR